MLTYLYTAKRLNGELIKAEVQAESEGSAAKLLIAQQLMPISIEPKDKQKQLLGIKLDRVKTKDMVVFTRQLSTLITAGLPITQSLRTVQEQISNRRLNEIIGQVVIDVEGGMSLAKAFGKHPDVFDQVFVSLIAAGEASGSLEKSLERIAYQQEKSAALMSKVRGALVYPAIILGVIFAVIIFMLTSVLPQIRQLYDDLNESLPFLTAILVGISDFILAYWWLLILLAIAGAIVLVRYLRTPPGRRAFDRFKLRVPLFKVLFQKLYMARFCRTGSILLLSGLPMLDMMSITQKAVNNVHIDEAIKRASEKLKGGKALSDSLEKEEEFLPLVSQMIRIGEASGNIDSMMDKTATFYEDELDSAAKNLSTTIEPILMIFLGLTVALIVAAILLPVYGLISIDNLGGGR